MEALRQLVVSLMVASLICGILFRLLPAGPVGKALRLVGSAFLLTTLLTSLYRMELPDLEEYFDGFSADARFSVEEGRSMAEQERLGLIKTGLEAYILERAACQAGTLTAEVTLDREGIPVSVELRGSLSRAAKEALAAVISDDLGIPEENQQWTEENKGN